MKVRGMRLLVLWGLLACPLLLTAAEPGAAAVVIYNSQLAESQGVALHYAAARRVPENQVLGFDLPETDAITRQDFNEKLARPLLARLQQLGLLVYDQAVSSNGWPGKFERARARYLVVCYGVPLRILEDPGLVESNQDRIDPILRRNGAAVDADLALLPSAGKFHLTGPVINPFFAATNASRLGPASGEFLVGRLDGPTPLIARQLVDKAMQAERDGLWGRAYFDLQGVTNGAFARGDAWIAAAADVVRRYGFDAVIDDHLACFPADFPMSQIALYAGWYAAAPCGPFARPQVEFMPGAFAYHLYSFSASTLRMASPTNESWCENLLAHGAAATIGYVDEPYLDGTVNIGIFLDRWLRGFSYGEAAFISQPALSWQTTVVGDPLYRPFDETPKQRHESLLARRSDLAAWSFVRIVNVEKELGLPAPQCIDFLTKASLLSQSSVMNEKLGDLYLQTGNWAPARRAYERALKLHPTPLERQRLAQEIDAIKRSHS